MIHLASSPAPNIKLLARSALRMLSSPVLVKASDSRLSETSTAALEVLRGWARGDGHDAEIHLVHPAEALQSTAPGRSLEISIEDWDILFRAVEARLLLSVGEKLAAVPRSQAGEAADLIQSIVLECVTALHQLHLALTEERGRRDPANRLDVQATQAPAIL